jgi:uncharacterized SAM-binding protein YcdF (DUF218 family)
LESPETKVASGHSGGGPRRLGKTVTFGNLTLTALLFTSFFCLLLWMKQDWIERLLVEPLEQRFRRADITSPQLTGIIALGRDTNRFSEAGRLARMYADLKVVVSDSMDLSRALAELGGGIDPSRVILETQSENTYQNAIYSAELVKPKAHQRWLLVTGALHMSRAIGSFRTAGFEVEPWPVYVRISPRPPRPRIAAQALHEWLGLIAYRLLGRTSELFPASSGLEY